MAQSTDPGARRPGKYQGYSFCTGKDIDRAPWYEDRGPNVLKVHCRMFRIPSRREFVVRHFSASTVDERADGQRVLRLLPRLFEHWEADGRAHRRKNTDGSWYWTAPVGTFLNDPLEHLQLKHSIDLSSEMSA
ncbi:hypothetical protein [Microbacterium oxydans]|uniref:hypothetical protein n=1 Tax=Microbacterium oxydans TaxID=82380 RepID=UPI0024AE5853|nr:hypothetical protein [Microbacterium oxydans]